jgi:acyl-CoA reductase-like NAD-dependent aldehyde dehydrogenase
VKTGDAIEIRSPYDQSVVAIVHRAGPAEIERAIAASTAAFQVTRKLPAWKRSDALEKVSAGIAAVDDSDFGLQAGLFTNNWNVIQDAFDGIGVGGLMVNDVSSYRIDHMPYGGVKQSGSGREGLRYAIEEMSELKLLTLNRLQ